MHAQPNMQETTEILSAENKQGKRYTVWGWGWDDEVRLLKRRRVDINDDVRQARERQLVQTNGQRLLQV
jgi:hypothetical protein